MRFWINIASTVCFAGVVTGVVGYSNWKSNKQGLEISKKTNER